MHDLEHDEHEYARQTGGTHDEVDDKWNAVTAHSQSENPNDWRLAIIEADIMLEQALEVLGLHGHTIGEMLKSANRATFHALDDAWQAHKVRNEIAHQGSDYILTKRIVNETLMRYRRVFDEIGTNGGGGGH